MFARKIFCVLACLGLTYSWILRVVHKPTRISSILNLRNVDRPELILFTSEKVAADRGVLRLVSEAIEEGTSIVFLCTQPGENHGSGFEKVLEGSPLRDQIPIIKSEGHPPPPHPGALSALRKSLEIIPDGFGGSSGFGMRAGDPPRSPLAERCVVFDDSVEGCLAARAAGMRAVAIHQEFDSVPGLERSCDIVFETIGEDGDCDFITFDDLYTPGSFWLNPSLPRDAEGNRCDPDTGDSEGTRVAREASEFVEEGTPQADGESDVTSADLNDDELARILGDMAPARQRSQ
uniref:Uncharacterized protein n=1 Tax=Octactis speculum TaxID=3111310 RepID=A0A7S2HAM1_9STRA|mmetsp:Transcript_62982/g.86559  ORF Transcript_62982/g.86559 Transcript_62982/m.86559 type:complete len:291 (+) Transcript_62982:85-957(+)